MDFTADEYARRDIARLTEVLAGPPVTWVFVGDSITQGSCHTHGRRNYVEHFAERVRGELGRSRDAVINSGQVGATAADLLPEFDWRVGRFGPDVVFVMFGSNDARAGDVGLREFHYDLGQVVERSRDLGAIVVLQTPPPVEAGSDRDPADVSAYAGQVRSVAEELGVTLIDHAAAWSAAGHGAAGGVPPGWLDDPAHPGPLGQHHLALTLFEALGIAGEESAVCSLEVQDPASVTA